MLNIRGRFWGFIAVASMALLGGGKPEAMASTGLKPIQVGAEKVWVELADTPSSRQVGLMNRANLPDSQGMLFKFDSPPTIQCMWMKNTLIDLDVAFLDESLRIINIERMKAGTTDSHCATQPSPWALEMNAKWFERKGVVAGDQIKLPSAVTSSKKQ